MRLLRESALLLTLVAFSACSDGTAPKPTSVNRHYVLEGLGGHPLPVTIVDLDVSLVVTSGTLTLDSTGNSIARTSIQEPTVPSGQGDFVSEMDATYVISRDSIYFGDHGQCEDICEPTRGGSFTDSVLTITDPSFTLDGGVFKYRIATN